MHRTTVSVLVGSLGLFGCDAAGAPAEFADPDFRDEVDNGQHLNSAVLNGLQFNGLQFNGLQFNGLQFNGLQFNGLQFNGLQFNGSSFSGTLDGAAKSGLDFEGAELKISSADANYTMRFDDIYKDPSRPNDDVYFYQISVRDDAVGTWSSLCKDADGVPVAAIPLANYWNYTTGARVDDANVITFACRGAALAKCVEWGYIPWHTAQACTGPTCSTVSLREYHQACTRMVRADYCGDGRSYTFDGTPIDVYDKLKVPIQTQATADNKAWKGEAEWGPNGATCVGDTLRMDMYDARSVPYVFPACIDAIDGLKDCGKLPPGRSNVSRIADAYCSVWTTDPGKCDPILNDDKKKP